jgi:hypothetical protein
MSRKFEIKYRDFIIKNRIYENGTIYGERGPDDFKALLKMDNRITEISKEILELFEKDDNTYDYINDEYTEYIFDLADGCFVEEYFGKDIDINEWNMMEFNYHINFIEPEPINTRISKIINKLSDIQLNGWNRADASREINEILDILR